MDVPLSKTPCLDPLKHPWSHCITVGRAYELLRADLQEHLLFLQKEFGYRHIRFHGSFHDDMAVVHTLPDGEIVYRWAQLDHGYDFLVDAGFDPIVEINPMPTPLASGTDTFFWYNMNVTPPADGKEWERFLQAYIEHTVERYGLERVRNWRFEVWNEPDLRNQFWTGSMEDYYNLYASCAKVLKGFDQKLSVGGPATASPAEALPFATWCRENGVPLDFLSYHSYPQNEACQFETAADSTSKPGMHFVDVMERTKSELAEAGFAELPLVMTEWNTQTQGADWKAKWSGNESSNNLFSGAAVCHLVHSCDSLLDVMGWWVASDVFEEGGPQVEPYGTRYQYYGMLTFDGVPKASFHAFRFLNRMRGKRYELTFTDNESPTRGGIVTDEGACTRALFWNCVFPYDEGANWDLSLELPVPAVFSDRKDIRITVARVQPGRGSAYETWQQMGAPANLTRFEQEMLTACAAPAHESWMVPVQDGKASCSVSLGENEFILIEIGGDPSGKAVIASAEQAALDQSLMT